MPIRADGIAEFFVPAFEGQCRIDAHERCVGWIGDSGTGEGAVKKCAEVADEVGFFHHRGLVLIEPRPGGGADAAWERAIAGQMQMAGFADSFFELERDLDAAAILMRDDGGQGPGAFVHRQPGGGQAIERDGVHFFCAGTQLMDDAADGFEDVGRIDFGADAVEVRVVGGANDFSDDFAVAQNSGFDGGGTEVEAE